MKLFDRKETKDKSKRARGADLIILLFLIVTIPHTADILRRFEYPEWWGLAWALAAAIDIGIAYGGTISASQVADKEARWWATALFLGLSAGSYALNVAHYWTFQAHPVAAFFMGAFFPIGILFLAKIKSRLETGHIETIKQPNKQSVAHDKALAELQVELAKLQGWHDNLIIRFDKVATELEEERAKPVKETIRLVPRLDEEMIEEIVTLAKRRPPLPELRQGLSEIAAKVQAA
jgi:hypothetical protein